METAKNPAAVALGAMGGKARARKLTPQRRSAIARRAGKARQKQRRADAASAR